MSDKDQHTNFSLGLLAGLLVFLIGFFAFWFAVIQPMRERTEANIQKTHDSLIELRTRMDERERQNRSDKKVSNATESPEQPSIAPETDFTVIEDPDERHAAEDAAGQERTYAPGLPADGQ